MVIDDIYADLLSFLSFLSLGGYISCRSASIKTNALKASDIKGSNLLIDNDGVLKIADFGLASCFDPHHKHPMTSRVVTLWYRPPELLLEATEYGVRVNLWSAGCILAELLAGKPIMPGQTEVFLSMASLFSQLDFVICASDFAGNIIWWKERTAGTVKFPKKNKSIAECGFLANFSQKLQKLEEYRMNQKSIDSMEVQRLESSLHEKKVLEMIGRKLKKNSVALDIVNFGEEDEGKTELETLLVAVNNNDTSHIVHVLAGTNALSDVLISIPIFTGNGEGGSGFAAAAAAAAAGGVSGFEFGVDPNLDPELALALRVSMERESQAESSYKKSCRRSF
ncbi:uncharacterized protein LOC130975134 [Arachis stenosperma]|uniref:uncharacterized protein LOC130975134 n=1 Tax=Arachis stenosperma TaxID=217475 RepID=UPI0025ABB67F|nr:uncharacterized protein LOC130975134 [Arachis stenosperma]